MGNKSTRSQGRYYYDQYYNSNNDARSVQNYDARSAHNYDARSVHNKDVRSDHNYDARSVQSSSTYASFSSRHDDWEKRSRIQTRYSRIGDEYYSLEEVTRALAEAGLESSNLIVGIDFTKSNEWTGSRSFQRKSLHHLGDSQNPYEQAISIIGRTLSSFDEDNLIPCYGFGDATTHDQEVFSFYPDNRSCDGFEDVLARYRELVPQVNLAGPTSFAPIIETAIDIVDKSGGQYHVLMIIADGQVTRSVDMVSGQLSPQEQSTINAIVKASQYPLSIVLVGVGDGPWDMMRKFDDNIPARAFDNFQFVNFTEIMLKNTSKSKKETDFALAALMEIPTQYKATLDLQLLGYRRGTPGRFPLPPPHRIAHGTSFRKSSYSRSYETENAPPKRAIPVSSFTESAYSRSYETEYAPPQRTIPMSPFTESSYSRTVPPSPFTESAYSRNIETENAPPCRTVPPSPFTESAYSRNIETENAPPCRTVPATPYSESAYWSSNETFYDMPSPETENSSYNKNCPVCLWSKKDLAFGCGHQTCYDCGRDLILCPICRTYVTTRIKLYD